jgi:Mitochondrial K+-H+ exchange-related
MDVFLVPLGPERHELYCEPSDDDDEAAGDTAAPAPGFFSRMRRRFTEMMRAAEVARARRARGEYDPIDTWWERTRARVLAKVADAVAEQRLLWHLRRLDAAHLYHPSDMTGEQALAIMRASMVRDRDRHFRWLVIDTLLMLVFGVGLFFVPGPNVIGYYFAFRVVGHYLSRKGAKQGLDIVTWTTAPCDPLIELRDALRLVPPQRDDRIDAIAERLHLPRLALFVNRICWPGSVEPRPAGGT